MLNEMFVIKNCSHANIVNVLEILEDKLNYYIVTEYLAGGNLFARLKYLTHFSENEAAHIVKQILMCLNYMHK